MSKNRRMRFLVIVLAVGMLTAFAWQAREATQGPPARNVILFVGDGMGVSTVTGARIFSYGVDGELAMDRFPHTALAKTYTADHITPDSAGTMTAMTTGVNANQGVIGFGPKTERRDFNGDGDGPRLTTIVEQAKAAGMRVGVVTNTRITHATPAACYAHVNDRGLEADIALQALPGASTYNGQLGNGIDLLLGGGRSFFVPSGVSDEEGDPGNRLDGRDLRAEFQSAGYHYIWNESQFALVTPTDLPILGLFDSSHMEYEHDRTGDKGGEPSLSEMTIRAIELLDRATSGSESGYLLVVEGGRIDHAHHSGNAFRALADTREFDRAIGATVDRVDLESTLVLATADHSHVFSIAGYPLRPLSELPYKPKSMAPGYEQSPNLLLDVVYGIDPDTGAVQAAPDANGVPYTTLQYANGPGARLRRRVDPHEDSFPGYLGQAEAIPTDPSYRQEGTVPLASETHGAEDVVIYGIGAGSELVHGTVKNTYVYTVMREALGLPVGNPAFVAAGDVELKSKR
ncbi:MAG: alkaline phosphatase [Planctomycetota bacterium]